MLDLISLKKAFGSQALFTTLSWRIQNGDRVGLIGPNGSGKTTLLRIAAGIESPDDGRVMRGRETRIGYLPQEVGARPAGRVLDHVLAAAQQLRGIEQELHETAHALAQLDAPGDGDGDGDGGDGGDGGDDDGGDDFHQRVVFLAARHAELVERHRLLEGATLEARAQAILEGLGLRPEQLAVPVASLSGGFGMRVELARLLLERPELLLLDEPTNHLDLPALTWLENFLQDYPGGWVVVSHDRYFLNRMVSHIAELSPSGIRVFVGNYDGYVQQRAELDELEEQRQIAHDKQRAHAERFVERFRHKATKARQVQSRIKALEKMEERHGAERLSPAPTAHRGMRLPLPEPPRSGHEVIRLVDVAKAYGETVVYERLNFAAHRGERIALVGPNGAGKSTLLKLLAQVTPPDRGRVQHGHAVLPFYFAQHQVDVLDAASTPLDTLWGAMPDGAEARVRGLLGAFLFSGDAVNKRIAVLSGGERSRLALARMLVRPVNLLLLDEPTNHLDLQACQVLEEALAAFAGTIIFVSHDRYFINHVATKIVEVRPVGRLVVYPGDYDYYLWKRDSVDANDDDDDAAAAGEGSPAPAGARDSGGGATGNTEAGKSPTAAADDWQRRKAETRQTQRQARRAQQLEELIADHEARIASIDATLSAPEVFSDANRCAQLAAQRQRLEADLKSHYDEWAEIFAD